MRGVCFVLGLLGVIWIVACAWITSRIWGMSEYCIDQQCHVFSGVSDRLNFITMNALTFTWAVAPVVVTLAIFPLLFFVIREVRRRKRAMKKAQ